MKNFFHAIFHQPEPNAEVVIFKYDMPGQKDQYLGTGTWRGGDFYDSKGEVIEKKLYDNFRWGYVDTPVSDDHATMDHRPVIELEAPKALGRISGEGMLYPEGRLGEAIQGRGFVVKVSELHNISMKGASLRSGVMGGIGVGVKLTDKHQKLYDFVLAYRSEYFPSSHRELEHPFISQCECKRQELISALDLVGIGGEMRIVSDRERLLD